MATYAYLCPTPKSHCSGTPGNYSAGLDKKGILKHGTPEEAKGCYCRYLVNELGYTRLSSNEYRPNDGGPIMLLSKSSRFGTRLRSGKSGEGSSGTKFRGMPPIRHGGIITTN